MLAVAACALCGCSGAGDKGLVASASVLDFGTNQLNATLDVAAARDGVNLAVDVEYDCPWLSVSPKRFFSNGPGQTTTLTFSAVRALMKPGRNNCRVLLRTQGHADQPIDIAAMAVVSADFRVSRATVAESEPVSFIDATRILTGAEPVTSWKWDFGDGETSEEQNPVHAFNAIGVYTVSLTVKSDSGSDVRVRPNYISVSEPSLPIADFEAASQRPVVNTPVQFRDLSVPGAIEISGWTWDFGDGGFSLEQNPAHLYAAAAIYDVYLTVKNANGIDTAVKFGYIEVQEITTSAN